MEQLILKEMLDIAQIMKVTSMKGCQEQAAVLDFSVRVVDVRLENVQARFLMRDVKMMVIVIQALNVWKTRPMG